MVPDGATIMVSGFMGCGSPHGIIDEMVRRGTCDLVMITNDAGRLEGPEGGGLYGTARLIEKKQVKKMFSSHVGLYPEVARQMNEGNLEVVLIPQGSFVEMIRAGGSGLGGVLTRTGFGTLVEGSEYVHSVVEIDGDKYLLKRPLRADVALIGGYKVDTTGNVWYKGTARGYSQFMATAADTVIVEAEHIVDVGGIEPENVMTSGIFVDFVAEGATAC